MSRGRRVAKRRPSSTDRRARVIAVTRTGERKVRAAETVLQRVREDVLGTLPADERQVFLTALGPLACGRLSEPVPCAHPVRLAPKPGPGPSRAIVRNEIRP